MVTPTKITIRAYDVGFGDCFLVTFHYAKENRAILIDYGSTGLKEGTDKKRMSDIAKNIAQYVKDECGGLLHGVVATHRHKDHISGFGGSTGAVIEALDPKIVIQPWTEEPGAKKDARAASGRLADSTASLSAMQDNYLAALDNMQAFSAAALAAVHDGMGAANEKKIKFLADDNLANEDAVERLARMGGKTIAEYCQRGLQEQAGESPAWSQGQRFGPPRLKTDRHHFEGAFARQGGVLALHEFLGIFAAGRGWRPGRKVALVSARRRG